jgi:glycosyltransferase involved in cell wall biosynthesis
VRRSRRWRWTELRFEAGSRARLASGLRQRAALGVAALVGPGRAPLAVAARAFGRFHDELARAAAAEPADLYYGGTSGALAATAQAARRRRAPYALDLEDFHDGEYGLSPDGARLAALCARIERPLIARAAFLTAASSAIAAAYQAAYQRRPLAVHNTFPLGPPPATPPAPARALRLYWFSQTIGPRRGLEDAVRAVGVAGIRAELHLRGRALPGYLESLRALAASAAPQLSLEAHPPLPPDELVASCRGFDVGLSLEQTEERHRALCLTNKALTYPLAGLALALTDTPGQRELARDLGDGALVAPPGDVATLGAGLRRWSEDPSLLARARAAARGAAERRWHWEHERERGALLGAVAGALGQRGSAS